MFFGIVFVIISFGFFFFFEGIIGFCCWMCRYFIRFFIVLFVYKGWVMFMGVVFCGTFLFIV